MKNKQFILYFITNLAPLYRIIFQEMKNFLHIMVVHSSTNQSMSISLDEKYGDLNGSA